MNTQDINAYVVGVGMTEFIKPGSRPDWDYPDMVRQAVSDALIDAQLEYSDVEQAIASFVYGQTCSGQRALYTVGMTGIPIYNVNNACASGSTALLLASQLVSGGICDCILVVGFEKMRSGSLEGMVNQDMNSVHPMDKHIQILADTFGLEPAPIVAQMFGNAGREHMQKYGTKMEHFAKIAWKNHKHSTKNKRSQFQKEFTMQEILNSSTIHSPLTKLQCCPTSDGAAAVIVCNQNYLSKKPHLARKAVKILAMTMATDFPSAFSENSNIKMIGYDAVEKCAQDLYKKSNLTPNDVQVIELHDCFSVNELITYEAIGLCQRGKACEIIDKNDNTYGGKWVINPSGGLISKGHPLGATGIAQCAELCWQLRGEAGQRQVSDVKVALQHNIGLGGAVVMAMYKMANLTNDMGKGLLHSSVSIFKTDSIFLAIQANAPKESEKLVKEINCRFKFKISKDDQFKIWSLDFSKNPVSVTESDGPFDCQISVSDDDFFQLSTGKIGAERLFMSGKLKINGNMAKALKLRQILETARINSKL